MGTFIEYKPPLPLPQIGEGFEQSTLDLKVKADLTKTAHLAKDIAAFANYLGGTLIIGAAEGTGGCIGAFVPLTKQELKDTQDAISLAVAQRCSPKPVIDFGHYPEGAGFVLTVLVWPFIGQPVGVRVRADKTLGGFGGDSYMFPVRSGSDTIELLPEQLSMYMIPELRKNLMLLSQISPGATLKLHTVNYSKAETPSTSIFRSVDILKNSLAIDNTSLPLDAVETVWQAPSGQINLVLKGFLNSRGDFHWVR